MGRGVCGCGRTGVELVGGRCKICRAKSQGRIDPPEKPHDDFPHPDAPDLPTVPPQGTVPAGVRLQYRTDHEAGEVRCSFAADDGSLSHVVATMKLAWLKKVPGLWDGWRKLMAESLNTVVETALGLTPGVAVTVAEEPKDPPAPDPAFAEGRKAEDFDADGDQP